MLYRIRRTESSDIEQLIDVEKSATQAFSSIPDLKWLIDAPVLSAETHYELITHVYAFSVVNEQDQVVGFLYAEKQDQDFYIIEFDVRSDLQRQGIGRKLIEHAITFATTENFKAITLTTFIDVTWNRPFYEKLGFIILESYEQPDYLKQTLENEVKFGFNAETRCAMQLKL
ncbi:GNAT family N-acetyltransferase [Acinetobacter wuhouensis]|uniref:GNAT family N-acetyltransferase n=1 Tax=Acinetobacter wuhouensis TaxID=1879050 RepID=UPI00083AA40D|nr:GNAT family N-acetyltransferase [Acinetobacter wuhouensis]AXQ23374.1 GNAT family N-acetyltransferase [Acinetobacter wuhouensis]